MGIRNFADAFDFTREGLTLLIQNAFYNKNSHEKIKTRISQLSALAGNDIHRIILLAASVKPDTAEEVRRMEEVSG